MNGHRDLYIDQAYHQNFVKVDEAGTEATAATAVVMMTKSKGPQVRRFLVNRPFLLAIRDQRTHTILFWGRVGDPTGWDPTG
jgi:serpin B